MNNNLSHTDKQHIYNMTMDSTTATQTSTTCQTPESLRHKTKQPNTDIMNLANTSNIKKLFRAPYKTYNIHILDPPRTYPTNKAAPGFISNWLPCVWLGMINNLQGRYKPYKDQEERALRTLKNKKLLRG